MRFLIAGLVCLVLGIALTEYTRRNPSKTEKPAEVGAGEQTAPKKPKLPRAVAELLELGEAGTEAMSASPELAALLQAPTTPALSGFNPVTEGTFTARELRGGFGAALFVIDGPNGSGIVRAATGEPAKLLLSRPGAITALYVDGSTVFFAEGGLVASTHARGGEGLTVRARFKNATVTSLAASGDTLVVTLLPKGTDPLSTDAVGAVVSISSSGELSLIAQDQVRPRAAQTDGKDAWWLAGAPSGLWRGALDGAFSSQLNDKAEEPLALDGDALYFRSPLGAGPELRRIGRAGGNLQTLIAADVGYLAASSGLVRFATVGAGAGLLELTVGAEASKLLALPGSARGVALGGTSLFLLTQAEDGRSVLWAK
jgi:hypothetical protein